MSKPIHAKPGLYALIYEELKLIAKSYGYCLLLHGSANRDLDLVAVPWIDNPQDEQDMIKDFQNYLVGKTEVNQKGGVPFTVLPGGRHSFVIDLNRGNRSGEWIRFEDNQWYLDISVVQLPTIFQDGNK